MKSLLSNIRFYILLTSLLLSGVFYFLVSLSFSPGLIRLVELQQLYSLAGLVYLYLTLLAGPLCYTFQWFPYRGQYLKARRALGVSAFYFGSLQALIVFFGFLGGFNGLGFLSTRYLIALGLGVIAFGIMFLLTITSTDYAVAKLTFPRWKLLHRFVYLAAALIFTDALMLAPYYRDLTSPVSQITFAAVAFLFLLEASRIDKLFAKFIKVPTFGLSFVILSVMLGVIFFTIINPLFSAGNGTISFDIHAAHKQLAAQALNQQQFSPSIDLSKMPGLNGDRNKRYTVSFNNPQNVQPNQDVELRFRVYDASNGNPVSLYRIIYTKPMHMIIVNNSLTYFKHIHPVQENQDFVITTQFPKDGLYHIYIEFQPYGGIEQQIGFVQKVGSGVNEQPTQPVDTQLTKTFGDYEISLNTNGGLNAHDMTLGNDRISFTVIDAKTKQPITNLKPYLASFGHLTMINQNSYDFLHVHPYSLLVPSPNANSGPTVDFLPIGIYGPFKPGIYRAFAEFNPDNNLIITDFTVEVK